MHPRQQLGQVDGGVGWVADAEQQHLPVQLVDAPHRAVDAVRISTGCGAVMRAARGASGGKESGCRCAGRPAAARRYRRPRPFLRCRVDRGSRVLIVPRHAGHHQRARGARAAWRAAINPAGPPSTGLTFERRGGRAARRPAEHRGVELGDQLGLKMGCSGMRESYHRPHQSRNSGGRKTPTAAPPTGEGEPYGFQSRRLPSGAAGR